MGNLAKVLDLFQKKNASNSKITIYVSFLSMINNYYKFYKINLTN